MWPQHHKPLSYRCRVCSKASIINSFAIGILITIFISNNAIAQPNSYDIFLGGYIRERLKLFNEEVERHDKVLVFKYCNPQKQDDTRQSFVYCFLERIFIDLNQRCKAGIVPCQPFNQWKQDVNQLYSDIKEKLVFDKNLIAAVTEAYNNIPNIDAVVPQSDSYDLYLDKYIQRMLKNFSTEVGLRQDNVLIIKNCGTEKHENSRAAFLNCFLSKIKDDLEQICLKKDKPCRPFDNYKEDFNQVYSDIQENLKTDKELIAAVTTAYNSIPKIPPVDLQPPPTPDTGEGENRNEQGYTGGRGQQQQFPGYHKDPWAFDSAFYKDISFRQKDTTKVTVNNNIPTASIPSSGIITWVPGSTKQWLQVIFGILIALVAGIVIGSYSASRKLWKPIESVSQFTDYDSPESLPGFSEVQFSKISELGPDFIKAITELSYPLQKSLFWTTRLSQRTRSGGIFCNSVPGYLFTAFGFLDHTHKRSRSSDAMKTADSFGLADAVRSFGVTVYYKKDFFYKLLLTVKKIFGQRYLRVILVDNQVFPVIYQPLKIKLQSFNCNPVTGTGTCYASSVNERKPTGILTARHVVEQDETVELSCNNAGTVVQLAPGVIDAAFIYSPCVAKHAIGVKEATPDKWIAVGKEVEFWGATSKKNVSAQISKVIDGGVLYKTVDLQAYFEISHSGQDGDSGALVKDINGTPLGIYRAVGSTKYWSVGFAENLGHAIENMNLKIYI